MTDPRIPPGAARHGLAPLHHGERGDLHGRDEVRWSELVFVRA